MFVYDTINTLLAIIFLFNAALLLPLLRNVRNNVQTFVYAINIVMILLWVVTMMGYRSQNEYFDTWLRALYVAAIFIGVTYMQFTFFYPTVLRNAKYYIYIVNILAFGTAYLVTLTNTIIAKGVASEVGEPGIVFGALYPLYIAIILVPFIAGFSRHIYLVYKKNIKVMYLLSGYSISANVAFITNLILPWFGIFIFNWVGQFFTVIMVLFTTYSILKFNVMNIRFFAINVGVVFLLIVTTAQVLFADSVKNLMVSGLVLFISSITGYYLVKINKSERDALDHSKLLNKKLADANEKLKSLDKLKSEFISLASHQLRSPLTVIKGYASTLTDGVVGELDPKQKEIIRHIYTSAQGLANVVEDFLNVTKIEQGGMKYEFGLVDIKQIAEDLSSDMRIAAEDRGLRFESEIDDAHDYTIEGDATKLKQVFLNLVDNSIKYTKEGFVKVSLTQNSLDKSMKFSVSDSGIGISKETKEKLFTKFGRGAGSALNGGGSGLGLYLAQAIVEAHKGTIEVSSQGEGKGSTFSVFLPLHLQTKK